MIKIILCIVGLMATLSDQVLASPEAYVPDQIHESWIPSESMSPTKTLKSFDEVDSYHAYDAKQYDLKIEFDPIEGTLTGSNTVGFTVTGENLKTLQFDALNMQIHDVRWADGSSLLYAYDQKILRITMPYELQRGFYGTVTVRFSTTRSEALNIAGPDVSRRGRVNSAYTYTQPDATRRWFPCHDIPSDKTVTSMTFIVPKNYMVASNGDETQPVNLVDGRVAYAFVSRQPIATYLTSVVMGPLKSELVGYHRNVPLLLSGPSYLMPALRKETSRTKQMMEVFERFTRTSYGFPKYRQSVAEGYNGSMEHQSATSMGGRRIVGDMSGESVVAHELAHQWFGDLVTCGLWGDMWLNEGFASYLPIVFFDAMGDRDDSLMNILSNRDWYFSSTTLANARALSTPDEWPSYDIFDQHSYAKGALVLQMMRSVANEGSLDGQGPEMFSKALSEYFRRHSYKNVRYFDLKAALEQVTGKSWEPFFKDWVLTKGHPEVSSQWGWTQGILSIDLSQDQALRAEDPWVAFGFPLTIQVVHEDGTSFVAKQWVNEKKHNFQFPTAKPVKAIVLDPMMLVPGKFTVNQDVNDWKAAYHAVSDSRAHAHIFSLVFRQFNDAVLGDFVRNAIATTKSPTTLALLARQLKGRDGLINEAQLVVESSLRRQASPVLLSPFAALESWLVSKLPEDQRATFAQLESKWRSARRVEEREFYLQALAFVDLRATQLMALTELEKSKWTDRDRIALSLVIAKTVNDVTKPFVLSMLAQSGTVNIARPFLDALVTQGFADPEVLPLAKIGAATHRSSAMRVKYVKLLGLQSTRKPEACDALLEVQDQISREGTTDDVKNLVPTVNEARAKLGC